MRAYPTAGRTRTGLTLLEVIVSLAIFLISIVAIGRLVQLATEQGIEVQLQTEALQKAQSKLAEVTAGVLPMSTNADRPFDPPLNLDDAYWTWTVQAEPADVPNLWHVQVIVKRKGDDGVFRQVVALNQLVLDPQMRGSTLQSAATAAASDSGSTTSSTTSSTTGNTTSGTTKTP